jgi:hypothetical protein
MAKGETEDRNEVADPSGQAGQRSGTPGRPGIHEGPMGEPASSGKTKWQGPTGGRDPVGEKEPGKSRGPGGSA